MNSLKGKKLDEFFRQELTRQEQPFEEYHWLVLEKRLKKNRRNRIITWFISSGLAAMLLLALGISFLMNQENEIPVQAKKSPAKDLSAKGEPALQEERPASGTPLASAGSGSRSRRADGFKPAEPGSILVHDDRERANAINDRPAPEPIYSSSSEPLGPVSFSRGVHEPPSLERTAVIALPVIRTAPADVIAAREQAREDQPLPEAGRPFKSSLSFSVFAGPDINGVNNLKNTGRGTSAGIALTYHMLPRLSITTGVAYAKKLYSTDFSNYRPNTSYTFPTNPSMVDADCRVLDIPLNLNYTLWQKKTNAIGLSAGMSSYLMLREDYSYDYQYGGKPGPAHYGVKNRNRHYLGVVNLGVEYQKQLGKNVSIGVSPYLKLPVTDIGYGNVKLESAGITTSLNFNLHALKSGKK